MPKYIFMITVLVFIFACAPDSHGADMTTPEVNHLWIILQKTSIDSIARTPFIKENFSAFQQQKVEAGPESWSGTYLVGQRAYMEFFSPGGLPGTDLGYAGIGFSTLKLGRIQTAKSSLISLAGDRVEDGLRIRVLDNDTVSWYQYLNLKSTATSTFFTWLMECTDEYLQKIGVPVDSTRRFDRHAYLTAKNGPSTNMPTSSTLFDDIVEIDLELTSEEQFDFELLARIIGAGIKSLSGISTYDFSNSVLKVQTNELRAYCIRRIVCSMTKAVDSPMRISFGPDVRVEFHDNLAIWNFGL